MELGGIGKDVLQKHKEMYYTACRVRTEKAMGSGIVIFSAFDKSQKAHTYILTNHHVISNAIQVKKVWDSALKRKIDKETLRPVEVDFFNYNDYSKSIGSNSYQADIVAYGHYEEGIDLALLELRERERKFDYVAKLYPKKVCKNVYMFDRVYAVGAGLGEPVFQTPGEVTNAAYEIEGKIYIGTNSPITFGNSGGGLFKFDNGHYYLIGVPAMVKLQGWADIANHIGFCVPIESIYQFLEENCYEHIWDSKHTIEEDAKRRRKKQKKAKSLLREELEEVEEKLKDEE
jgi:S1-C subfamily serine protease